MKTARILLTIGFILVTQFTFAQRLKDIATLAGVRDNQLVGYGLVVGLSGTGDATTRAPFTAQSFANMLRRLNVRLPKGVRLDLKNVAAVAVSANLPPFAKRGQTIDVAVSSIGNAESLRGGTLLMTPLRGADDKIYAMAQGSVVVTGITARSRDGSKVTVNVPSNGAIPNGATVEREVPARYANMGFVEFNLYRPDFTTANRVVDAINRAAKRNIAFAEDAGTIRVGMPSKMDASVNVAFLSKLENLILKPGDAPAKVVVNSKTGAVVIGQHVRVLPAAVSQGNIAITITENPSVIQPYSFSGGQTVILNQAQIAIKQERGPAIVVKSGASLDQIVNTINRIGASPGDLVAVLQALEEVGALQAKLVVQ